MGEQNQHNQIKIVENTEDIIRSLIAVQESQGEQMKELATVIDAIRESIMNDKKVLLKNMMYACLDKGYATREEDERIRLEYKSYTGLHGNGTVKELYEGRYLKLPIHHKKKLLLRSLFSKRSDRFDE